MMRVDLFTTIHNGLRSLLFETATEAARVDLASDEAVDALAEHVERALGFLHEHAQVEDAEIVPLLRRVDPGVAAKLTADHLELEATQSEVCRAMRSVAMTVATDRGPRGRVLVRLLNVLTARHLLHMEEEETLGNAVLWGSFGDPELHEVRRRMYVRTPPERRKQWQLLLSLVRDPREQVPWQSIDDSR